VGSSSDASLEIKNSFSTGDVTGTESSVGGLVGGSNGGNILQSYATGDVRGFSNVGGILGSNNGSIFMISNSYATDNVTTPYPFGYIGGLVGLYTGTATIEYSYATGSVTNGQYVGGLVGATSQGITIRNSVALNPRLTDITGTGSPRRILGSEGTLVTLTNNWARIMQINGTILYYSFPFGAGSLHGASIVDPFSVPIIPPTTHTPIATLRNYLTELWWRGQAGLTNHGPGFNPSPGPDVWHLQDGQLPRLLNTPGGEAAQNPVLQ
jgi:hypothetical protein